MNNGKNNSLFASFNRALRGIFYVVKTQRNMRIHLVLAFIALTISLFMNLDRKEVILLSLTIALVLITETLNTVIELISNLITDEINPLVKVIKDVSAGAVLFSAINALVVGYLIFLRKQGVAYYSGEPIFAKIQQSPEYIGIICLAVILVLVFSGKAYSRRGVPLRGGMPSGHTAFAFALSTACGFISRNLLLTGLTLILAGMVAESRVKAGIHTRREVIMGGLIGVLTTVLIFQAFGG